MQERDWWWKTFIYKMWKYRLADIQNKYNINDPNKVFKEGLSKERMIKIAKFIDKTEMEKNI